MYFHCQYYLKSIVEFVSPDPAFFEKERDLHQAFADDTALYHSFFVRIMRKKLEEGKIIEGKINKITEKYVFLHVDGLKSEPVLDINELKTMGLSEKIKIGEKISVLLEKLEDKMGEVVVSASKAQKIKGWDKLVEAYEKKEPIMGKIVSKCKGHTCLNYLISSVI